MSGDDYEAKPALQNAGLLGLQSAGVGLVVSAVQNALETHKKGATGIFTRTGGTIGFFAAMGAIFSFTEASVANVRATDDYWNGAVGGCAAGFLAGVRARSIPTAVGSCAIIGGIIGAYGLSGQRLGGDGRELESPTHKEARREAFFKKPRPISAE